MAELDLVRLAYVAKHRADELGLTYQRLARMSGASQRQISYLMNGKPVNAAATFLLAELLDIDLLDMLPPVLCEKLKAVRAMHESHKIQSVTPLVPRVSTDKSRARACPQRETSKPAPDVLGKSRAGRQPERDGEKANTSRAERKETSCAI